MLIDSSDGFYRKKIHKIKRMIGARIVTVFIALPVEKRLTSARHATSITTIQISKSKPSRFMNTANQTRSGFIALPPLMSIAGIKMTESKKFGTVDHAMAARTSSIEAWPPRRFPIQKN